MQCTVAHVYKTTHRNKTANIARIKHTFIALVLPTKSVFKHKKHAVHKIHRLSWGPYTRRTPGNCPACQCAMTALVLIYIILMTYIDNPEGDIPSMEVLLFVPRNVHIVVMFHKMPPEIILTSTDDY